jgi:hypothetical protein
MQTSALTSLQLLTEAGCGLAIGAYPRFRYDARGGGGRADLGPCDRPGWQALAFDPAQLTIPALTGRSTRVLGLPLPPGLMISIQPEKLHGEWQPSSGEVQLDFAARFYFSIGSVYRAPGLMIETRLQSECVQGQRHQAQGQRVDRAGRALLVGVATVPPTGEAWLDRFLGLPNGALAMLRCRITV